MVERGKLQSFNKILISFKKKPKDIITYAIYTLC